MLSLASLGIAGRNWVAQWRGFDQLEMSVDRVDFNEQDRAITVTTRFFNGSDQVIEIHTLDTGLRLSGRSITGGSERYSQQLLQPGDLVELQTEQRVHGQEVAIVRDAISAGDEVWNVTGRVRVSVDDLSDPIWLPFRYELDAGS